MHGVRWRYPRALSIAGSDSGGGAGIQADLKTFAALGCYGMTAITALTAQNTLGVRSVHPVTATVLREQTDAVLQDLGADAVKIGMLPDASLVEVVAQAIRRYELRCVVFDPVMVSTSGAALMDAQAMDLVARVLIPRVQLVTPNLDEAALLLARPVQTRPEMEAAAAELLARGAAAVLLKGGHLSGDGVHDLLLRPGRAPLWFSAPRIVTGNAHGTGCTLSSAIAAGLARGLELEAAVGQAHQFVRAALHSGADVATGSGNGPLNHGFAPQPMHRLPLQRL